MASFLSITPELVDHVYDVSEEGSFTVTCDFGNDIGKWSQIQYVMMAALANYILTGKKNVRSR